MKLETLIRNPYASRGVTDTRLTGAALVALPKYTAAKGGGEYTTVIADILAATTPMHDKIGEIQTDLSFDKGFTENRETVAANFEKFVSSNFLDVQVVYKTNRAKLLEFYPNGMAPYNAGNKSTWATLMKFYAKAANRNSADFPAQFVTDASAFEGLYTDASDEQAAGQTNTGMARADRNTFRGPLEKALWRGMHEVFIVTNGNLTAIKAIIDLKSMEPQPRTEIQHFNSAIDVNATINVMKENFDISYVFLLRNTGTTDLRICFSPDAATGCTIEGETLRGGKTHTFLAPTLGPFTNHFLNITNLDLSTTGLFQLSVYRQ